MTFFQRNKYVVLTPRRFHWVCTTCTIARSLNNQQILTIVFQLKQIDNCDQSLFKVRNSDFQKGFVYLVVKNMLPTTLKYNNFRYKIRINVIENSDNSDETSPLKTRSLTH